MVFLYILKYKINKGFKDHYNISMGKLLTLNNSELSKFEEMINDDIIVFEDIQASKIWVNWDGKIFTIRPRSVSSDPINLIDLAIQNYYNPAIKYFESFSDRIKGLMPKKWYFCFEFFPDSQPANIEYSKVPKNGLVLTSIYKSGKYEVNLDEVEEFSRLFEVDCLPIIFQGKLTEKMKEGIKYFLNTSENDLEYVFGEKSFSFFFYKILNPSISNSFLMDDGDFQKNIEKLVIRSKNGDLSFEILNPLYQKISSDNSTEFTDVYTLILVNFLNFCQSLNISDIKIKANRRDDSYIYLISKIFNLYISDIKDDLLNFEFSIPKFFDKDKFRINRNLILNKSTIDIIEESEKLEYIYKVVLGSFNKKKKKPIGIFTENTILTFNKLVDEIQMVIDDHLNKMREVQITKSGLMDFNDFFDIKYDVDGSKDVYPQVWDEMEKSTSKKKGKKSKGKLPDSK